MTRHYKYRCYKRCILRMSNTWLGHISMFARNFKAAKSIDIYWSTKISSYKFDVWCLYGAVTELSICNKKITCFFFQTKQICQYWPMNSKFFYQYKVTAIASSSRLLFAWFFCYSVGFKIVRENRIQFATVTQTNIHLCNAVYYMHIDCDS